MEDAVVIVSAARTPVGSFLGTLSALSAPDLGCVAVKAALERACLSADVVDEVIMGQVLTSGQGQNPARQTALRSGLRDTSTAITINQVCGSGLRAIALGAQSLMLGDAHVIVAGGQENMSQAPHVAVLRQGHKMGDVSLVDTMIRDGLWCAFNDVHMGITAENIAERSSVSRQEQDEFSVRSQNKAEHAQKSGLFDDEISPVVVAGRKGDVTVSQDEYIRHGATVEALSALRPAFKKDGTVTAGNASGLNDGAAAVVLMRESEAKAKGLKPMARLVSWATAGVDPAVMGMGPVPASQKALAKAGWSVDDLDLIEANEAFAAQALGVQKAMGWNPDKVNVHGGAIALGHPIGASGARVLVTLLYALQQRGLHRGLATLCIGGGMGIAVCVERV